MEFSEKLLQLRKQHELTQEQLAEKLYVSRTAISKWESGKGYPNIDSLKSISRLFSVSIDDLLSGEELITLAETENRINIGQIYHLIYAVIDLMSLAFIGLPLYGQADGSSFIGMVNLLSFTSTAPYILAVYWTGLLVILALGILQLALIRLEQERWRALCSKISIVMAVLGVNFFIASQQPYASSFLFLLLILKIFLLFKHSRLK